MREAVALGHMPRQARLDASGTLHHVMARGIEGTNIFTVRIMGTSYIVPVKRENENILSYIKTAS